MLSIGTYFLLIKTVSIQMYDDIVNISNTHSKLNQLFYFPKFATYTLHKVQNVIKKSATQLTNYNSILIIFIHTNKIIVKQNFNIRY